MKLSDTQLRSTSSSKSSDDASMQLDSKSLNLASYSADVFDYVTTSSRKITKESLFDWEAQLDELTNDIRKLQDTKALLHIYETILRKSAPIILDPLQITTFELIAGAVIDTLISLFPRNTPITALIDEITELHLEFVEKFRVYIDSADEDDGSHYRTYFIVLYHIDSINAEKLRVPLKRHCATNWPGCCNAYMRDSVDR